MTDPETSASGAAGGEGLAAGIVAEYALIYGYGVAGAHLVDKVAVLRAAEAESAHRDLRDTVALYLSGKDVAAPAAEPGYVLPFEVTDEGSAVELILAMEQAAAETWRLALSQTSQEDRRQALAGLTTAATELARWRRTLGEAPVTEAFPGRPG